MPVDGYRWNLYKRVIWLFSVLGANENVQSILFTRFLWLVWIHNRCWDKWILLKLYMYYEVLRPLYKNNFRTHKNYITQYQASKWQQLCKAWKNNTPNLLKNVMLHEWRHEIAQPRMLFMFHVYFVQFTNSKS